MPYLRRLVLLLTLSTSILLVTVHLLHFTRPRHQEPLHPVISKEDAEKNFDYLKQYDHPIRPEDLMVPNQDYVNKIVFGKDPPTPPKKEDVHAPVPEEKDSKPKPTTEPIEQKTSKVEAKPAEQKDLKADEQKDVKPGSKVNPLPPSKVAPPNATAWHKDKNLWKVVDALNNR